MRHNKYSDLKIAAFPDKLASFRRGEITAPIYVRVKPINLCNHGCRWCVYKADRKAGDAAMAAVDSHMHTDMVEKDTIPSEKMFETLSDFQRIGVKAVTFSGGGEPLLHRDIVAFLQRTLNYGIDLSIITNGQLLTGERAAVLGYAKWVRVSMDYTIAAQMAHSRVVPGRLFDQVLENLQTFARTKQPYCDLAVNFIVHRENHAGLEDFAHRLFTLGVENIRFSPMWCPDYAAYHEPIQPAVEAQLRRIGHAASAAGRSVNTTYDLHAPGHSPVRHYTKCFFTQVVPVVGADQKVYACHNKAYDATGCIGSIAHQSFADLWFSPEAKTFFDTLNPQVACQHQCANDTKNLNIHRLLDAAPDHFV